MSLFLLSVLFAKEALASSSPWSFKWADEAVGPDGPWNALFVPVDQPLQNLTLLPALTQTALLIEQSSCSNQLSACPLPTPLTLWTNSTSHSAYIYMNSEPWEASSWDDTVSGPLRLEGSGLWIHEKITLASDSESHDLLEDVASLTGNFTVNYPGGANYTMDIGFFSLNGAQDNLTWTSENGSAITLGIQLPIAYDDGLIPSNSFGITVGSPSLGIDPSLVLGGYDRSRCLTDPLSSDNQTFELVDIRITTKDADWGFLSANKSQSGSGPLGSSGFQVMPNPGVPYLYLPQSTCDAIASFLPVTYNKDFGLYLWNTDDSAFNYIVSSPSYLAFTMQGSSAGTNSTIAVPFALLNLTLEYPLVGSPTPYFPCSPYSPSDDTYHLGRAFLQAALLAQNWQTNTTWLAQAPGPNMPSTQVTQIGESDTTLAKMINGPDVYSTWSSTLTSTSYAGTSNSSSSTSTSKPSSSSLSGGAIAGIVIGVIAAIAVIGIAAFYLWRGRSKKSNGEEMSLNPRNDFQPETAHTTEAEEKVMSEAGSTPIYEVPSPDKRDLGYMQKKAEPIEAGGHSLAELPAQELDHGR